MLKSQLTKMTTFRIIAKSHKNLEWKLLLTKISQSHLITTAKHTLICSLLPPIHLSAAPGAAPSSECENKMFINKDAPKNEVIDSVDSCILKISHVSSLADPNETFVNYLSVRWNCLPSFASARELGFVKSIHYGIYWNIEIPYFWARLRV